MFNRFNDEINLGNLVAEFEADALLAAAEPFDPRLYCMKTPDPLDIALPIDQVMVEWTNNHPGAGALWCREGAQICTVM